MRINNLRYNDRARAFEAFVDMNRDGQFLRYTCAVEGPASMDPLLIAANLRDRAKRLSERPRKHSGFLHKICTNLTDPLGMGHLDVAHQQGANQ